MKLPPHLRPSASPEPLEARIAPAVILANPLPDIVAGPGKTGATIDLSELFDPQALYPHHTLVEFTTNVDTDPATPGLQAGKIVIELFDDEAPLTVQNFLAYVNSTNKKGDYDNTIIHRSFDFGGTFQTGIDIIQGGGFEPPSSSVTHVVTGPDVHNEFSNSRPNTRGTIAMAKTGLSPNTATSEWFFNVNDNTSVLGDDNNGGFTVFGRVLSGIEVVDQIAAFSKVNLGGVLSDLPTQNYNSNPDNNSSTPSPTPTLDQFIRIVDAKVIPSTGNTAGVTFTIDSILPVGGTPSDLLTGAVQDQTLTLKYKANRSGFVDVTVKATPGDGSAPVLDTFRVDVRPNLFIDFASDGLQGVILSGDSATVKLNLTNNGAATAIGQAKLQIGLLKTTATRNNLGQITGFAPDATATPVTIATLDSVAISLGSGKTAGYSLQVKLPSGLAPEDIAADVEGTVYQLVAQVIPVAGDITTSDRFTDDNSGRSAELHHAMNRFGTFTSDLARFGFGGRTNAPITYSDDQGTPEDPTDDTFVTMSMKGDGFARLSLLEGGRVALETFQTSAKSTLDAKVSKRGAHVPIASAQFASTLGVANLGSIDLEDYLFAAGGVKTLTLGDVKGQATMLIGQYPPDNLTKTTLKFGRVADLSLESFMPIASLTAIEWIDTEGTPNDAITALGLGALKITGTPGATGIRGDFEADLRIDSDGPTASISIAGLLRNAAIRTSGSIGTVTLGGMDSSSLFAGVTELPDDRSDFTSASSIASFTIKGTFTDSQVAAATLGNVRVTGVATTSGTGDFGFLADAIRNYNRVGVKTARNVTLPTDIEHQANYLVRVL